MSAPEASDVRAELEARLTTDSMAHCERVAATAGELAGRLGVDVEAARLAGLLHDYERDACGEELLRSAGRWGVPVTSVDEQAPYLLHAPVAAAELASRYPGLDREVLEAVATHTVGAPRMGPIAKIVYVADMIEPVRAFAGVDALREAAEAVTPDGLDALFAQAYAHTIRHLVGSRSAIHPRSVETWNRLVVGGLG